MIIRDIIVGRVCNVFYMAEVTIHRLPIAIGGKITTDHNVIRPFYGTFDLLIFKVA